MNRAAVLYALASAALFGASTPLAKLLVGEVQPLALAGLLYLGSGLGLLAWFLLRRRGQRATNLSRADLPWLAGAILAGGVVGPALLMYGLTRTDGATASLLLNLEAVLTASIAWIVFRENVDRRVFLGMVAIVAGGVVLSWDEMPRAGGLAGPLLIAGACLAWAIDNNLTRRVSGGDAVTIAGLKGLVAGAANLSIALFHGASLPGTGILASAAAVGFFGYGISLVLFVVALRNLGTARTGAYFSVAPFFGAALALLVLRESPSAAFWIAAALMALGVWLHVTERHEHEHLHEPMEHTHPHVHDEHHRHGHGFEWQGDEPHAHPHTHRRMTHSHPHYPDLHHRHDHG
ncbi:MAG TPA: EamA family transporter [Burkholderiales bacterium]|nr:EamA family transporter [Burkholderiales bacterium]